MKKRIIIVLGFMSLLIIGFLFSQLWRYNDYNPYFVENYDGFDFIYNKENHGSYIGIKINDKLNIYIRAFDITNTTTGDITDITEATYRNLLMQLMDKNKDIIELNGVIFVSNDDSDTYESMILRNTSMTIGDYTYSMSYDSRLEISKVHNKE